MRGMATKAHWRQFLTWYGILMLIGIVVLAVNLVVVVTAYPSPVWLPFVGIACVIPGMIVVLRNYAKRNRF